MFVHEFDIKVIPLSKPTAYRVKAMASARLICCKHLNPWADEIISSLDNPPHWILELATSKYIGDVRKVLDGYIFSEPFENMDGDRYYRDYLASLLLRYRRRELSWASFLDAVGRFTDSSEGGSHPCEYFFGMLNDFEDSNFDSALEESQVKLILVEYGSAVQDLSPIYQEFLRFYPVQNPAK
jgi:hypothetical protein